MPDLTLVLSGSADLPVVDETGLTGVWRASVFVPSLILTAGLGPQDVFSVRASEPRDFSMLFKSLEKLGLKLESKKEPIDVLVIDHAERTPNEN